MFGNQGYLPRTPYDYGTTPHESIAPVNMNPQNYSQSYEKTSMQQNFPYPPNAYNITNDESPLVVTIEMREQDERFFENFLKENEQELQVVQKNRDDKKSRISETRTALISVYKLNKEMKELSAELKSNKNIPEDEWEEKINICQRKRTEILDLLGKLKDAELVGNVKKNLERRKKKRLREKKLRSSRQIEKATANERRAQLHAEADAWIKDKQEELEKEKQEVNLRKDADMVLAEVRGKRSDARKFLGNLQELQNLRKIKANIARARGEHLSTAADEAFDNIIMKLLEQWTALDREYSIEEQGLKLMLKTDNEEKIANQKRNIFDDWETVLFGKKLPATDPIQKDLHAFVTIRAAWDKYISYDGQGSPIPIGWVMPEPPSNAAWQKYLKKE